MACSHLAAAPSAATAAARARSAAPSSPAPAFARVPATPRFASGALSARGGKVASPVAVGAAPAAAAPVADLDGRPATEKQPIIVIDNYDSFTYNLCQYMGELGLNFEVYRNDELTIEDVKSPFTAARYHSLVIEEETFPHDALEATAWTEDGLIMAARHKKYKHIQGVQFHPESIITPEGKKIILNFVKFIEELEKQRS
nr:unnamed protein product [Digitaria exilis]